jgi:hypothetical protein
VGLLSIGLLDFSMQPSPRLCNTLNLVVPLTGSHAHLAYDVSPAGFLIGPQREFCRAWPNQQEVTVKGAHFLPEDSPAEVGDAIARFVAQVLARQLASDLLPQPAC